MSLKKLGQYTILDRTRLAIGQQKLKFRVSKQGGGSSQLVAELSLLSPRDVNQLKGQKIIDLFERSDCFIEEMQFCQKENQQYQIMIKDQSQEKADAIELEEVLNSQIDCRRLICEALVLIQQLHWIGLRLVRPLQDYLQFKVQKKRSNGCSVNFLRFNSRFSDYNILNASLDSRKIRNTKLSIQEINFLCLFYCKIEQRIQSSSFRSRDLLKRLQSLLRFLKGSIQQSKQISLQFLRTQIFSFEVLQKKFSLCCFFDAKIERLKVQIFDNQLKKMHQFEEENFITSVNERKIRINQFFYALTSAKQEQIFITTQKTIIFYDRQTLSWRTFIFSNVMKKSELSIDISEELNEEEKLFDDESITTIKVQPFLEEVEEQGEVIYFKDMKDFPMVSQLNPYDFIVKVQCFFKSKQKVNRGIGSLIGKRLVVTCAHLIWTELQAGFSRRFEAEQIFILSAGNGGKRIKVQRKMYPNQFKNYPKYTVEARENDFALLYLSQEIECSSCVVLAQNYQTKSQLQMLKIRQEKGVYKFKLNESEQEQVPDTSIIFYNIESRWGDSGTPLIVKYFREVNLFLLISIHSAAYKGIKQGTKITSKMIERLLQFESEIVPQKYREIRSNIVKFEEIMKKKLRIEQQQEEKLKTTKIIKGQVNVIEQAESQSKLLAREFLEIKLRRCLGNIRLSSEFPAFDPKNRNAWHNFLQQKQSNQFVNQIKSLIYQITQIVTQRIQRLENVCNILQKLEVDKQFFQQLQSVAVIIKIIQKKPERLTWILYVRHFKLMELTISAINLLNLIFPSANFDQLGLNLLPEAVSALTKNIPKQNINKKLFSQDFLPYAYLEHEGYYPGLCFNQIQYQVQFDCQETLSIAFWSLVKYNHSQMVLLLPQRSHKSVFYILKVKFYFDHIFFLDSFEAFQQMKYWLKILLRIVSFISDLHDRQMHLCTPIEYCMFLDQNLFPFFFYFQSPLALQRKVKGLIGKEVIKLNEYYPVEQILSSSADSKDNFDKIDVWMLGKFLQRSLSMRICQNFCGQEYVCWLTSLISQMTCPSESRMNIQMVRDKIFYHIQAVQKNIYRNRVF